MSVVISIWCFYVCFYIMTHLRIKGMSSWLKSNSIPRLKCMQKSVANTPQSQQLLCTLTHNHTLLSGPRARWPMGRQACTCVLALQLLFLLLLSADFAAATPTVQAVKMLGAITRYVCLYHLYCSSCYFCSYYYFNTCRGQLCDVYSCQPLKSKSIFLRNTQRMFSIECDVKQKHAIKYMPSNRYQYMQACTCVHM